MKRKFTDSELMEVETKTSHYNELSQKASENLNAYIRLYSERNRLTITSGLLPVCITKDLEYIRLRYKFRFLFSELRRLNKLYSKQIKELHEIKRQNLTALKPYNNEN